MLSRRTWAATAAIAWLDLAVGAAAIATQDPAEVPMFTQAMCVVSVSKEAQFVSLMDPDTEDPNAAAAIAFKVLPEIAPGDLVRLTPNTAAGATDPTVKVEKRAAESCKTLPLEPRPLRTGQGGPESRDFLRRPAHY